MSEIRFAFQNWSHNYDWFVPNNWPPDFLIDGKLTMPYSHGHLYWDTKYQGIAEGKVDDFKGRADKWDLLYNYKSIKFQCIDDIQDQRYIFPIIVRSWRYFIQMANYGLSFVSQKVIDDVKRGLAKILFVAPTEGIFGEPDWTVLDRWVKERGLTKNQVHLIHCNASLPVSEYGFTYHYHDNYICSFETRNEIATYAPSGVQNLFLCYNRVRKKHRTLLVCELVAGNLAHRGFVSYYNGDQQTRNLVLSYDRHDLIDIATLLDLSKGLSIDVDLSTSNPAAQLNYAHFQGSFLSLVTETLVEDELLFPKKEDHKDNFPIFFTEKTYRPIAAGHPFIIFGTRYHLMKLKEQGFATFASWWSEDYDNELDANKKTKMIVEEIRKLSLLSTDKLIQMRIEMEPVLRHNQALLKSLQQQSEYCGEEPVYKIIQEIWSGF